MRLFFCALLLLLAVPHPAAAETLRVVTRENAIRSECRFLAPATKKVKYRDELLLLSREGDWMRVSFQGAKGCIHKTALEKKSFSLASGFAAQGSGVSSGEVALAGKGFNPQVEQRFREGHPEYDFRLVDQLEKSVVPLENLRKFITEGGLVAP